MLENALTYLEKAERYELMNDVFKILLPFYERERDYKVRQSTHKNETCYCAILYQMMMEMYGRLHEAFTKVVSIMKTGKRYLGTYFRVAFYGHVSNSSFLSHTNQHILKLYCNYMYVLLHGCIKGGRAGGQSSPGYYALLPKTPKDQKISQYDIFHIVQVFCTI